MLMMMALLASGAAVEVDQRTARMAALYEEVCLKAFPNDRAVAELMALREARELTPEEVKVTMVDDPARGWELEGGDATVWIEFPPYHACSVRWSAAQIGDLQPYRAIAARYEGAIGGFHPIKPMDGNKDDIHIHAVGEQRKLPAGGFESLYIFDQHIRDRKRRKAGETGVSLRFVHQFVGE